VPKSIPVTNPRPGQLVRQIRGILAEHVIVTTTLDPFLTLKALASYSGMSVRKLREYLAASVHPLPYYRVGGKILVRRSEFDTWMASHRQAHGAGVAGIVNDVLQGLHR
jgi:excisionase family DNA binding protein